MIAAMSGILRAELSASALAHNVGQLRRVIGPDVEICAVVKADAYGHGLRVLYPTLRDRVDRLAVTLPPTALALREMGWEGPILTFFRAAGCAPRAAVGDRVSELARAGVTVTVVGEADVELLEAVASRVGRPVEAHLKIDTGMSRSGVLAGEAAALMARLRRSPGVRATGVYTQIAVNRPRSPRSGPAPAAWQIRMPRYSSQAKAASARNWWRESSTSTASAARDPSSQSTAAPYRSH
jgi:alanine racemase